MCHIAMCSEPVDQLVPPSIVRNIKIRTQRFPNILGQEKLDVCPESLQIFFCFYIKVLKEDSKDSEVFKDLCFLGKQNVGIKGPTKNCPHDPQTGAFQRVLFL